MGEEVAARLNVNRSLLRWNEESVEGVTLVV
jgi:hypothetical protein